MQGRQATSNANREVGNESNVGNNTVRADQTNIHAVILASGTTLKDTRNGALTKAEQAAGDGSATTYLQLNGVVDIE